MTIDNGNSNARFPMIGKPDTSLLTHHETGTTDDLRRSSLRRHHKK